MENLRGTNDTRDARVYVTNLSLHTLGWRLREHFQQAGEIVWSEIFADFKSSQSSHSEGGRGYVVFSCPEEADVAANTLNGKVLDGSALRVVPWVSGLGTEATSEAADSAIRGYKSRGATRAGTRSAPRSATSSATCTGTAAGPAPSTNATSPEPGFKMENDAGIRDRPSEECEGMREVQLLNSAFGHVVTTTDAMTASRLLVLIGGLNPNSAIVMNPWRKQYCTHALASGFGVVVCNPNYGEAQHFAEHVEAALNDVVLRAPARALYFVVHSAAGPALLEALAKCSSRSMERVVGIAFLDSAHRLPASKLEGWLCGFCAAENPLHKRSCNLCHSRKPDSDGVGGPACRSMIARVGRNWISEEFLTAHIREAGESQSRDTGNAAVWRPVSALGSLLHDVPGLHERFGCDSVDCGDASHEDVPTMAEVQVFEFFGV